MSGSKVTFSYVPNWTPLQPGPVLPGLVGPATTVVTQSPPNSGSGRNGSQTVQHDTSSSTSDTLTLRAVVTDDAGGYFMQEGADGLIDYGAGTFTLKVEAESSASSYKTDYASSSESSSVGVVTRTQASGQKSGEWGSTTQKWTFAGGAVRVRYRPAGHTPSAKTHTFTPPPVVIDLCPYTTDRIVPGSVQFTWLGHVYRDYDGRLYRDGTESTAGTLAGTIDYTSGLATITNHAVGSGGFTLDMLWTSRGDWKTARLMLRTPAAPVTVSGFTLSVLDWSGEQIIVTSNEDGTLVGPHAEGEFDYETGLAFLTFGDWVLAANLTEDDLASHWYDPANITPAGLIWKPWPVDLASARYNAITYVYLPMDSDVLGIDAVRLPPDGRVPIFRTGEVVLVLHTASTGPVTPGLIIDGESTHYEVDCGRTRLGWVRVIDANGDTVTDGYALDRETGRVIFPTLDGLALPLQIEHTVYDQRTVRDVLVTGEIMLSRELTHAYPAGESIVSSALIHGDRRARVSAVFDQATWNGTWSDALIGAEAIATLDTIAHPIQVTNEGAITERWLLRWLTTATVELIGERRGLVYTGPFTSDIAPINPATRNPDGTGGVPYLLIPAAANGGGWSAGNVVRINTVGAQADLWVAQAIQQSDVPPAGTTTGVELRALGNVDDA
jgi:hypothetical protein